ncbi:biosynthetic peptidoglycan transglycosylase [Hankyongella ginsenosidimutans]|uniref:transglycosylase domain-containing protein n=1 Tax=Hankyongella ginsenosidimutans TaxID=1763828 RepID=UPI00319E2B0B
MALRTVQVLGPCSSGAAGLAVAVGLTASTLPSFQTLVKTPRGQLVTVRGVDGTVIATVGPAYGEWIAGDRLPETIKDAMVSIEDRRFYSHIGVDPQGIARALQVNLAAGRFVQGGSTITQQVAKNVFLTSERTFGRKARELVMALALEWKFSKAQILELYLNRVYFGGGAYGVDAASRRFFGHSARNLSLAEAAVIAGLVKAPAVTRPPPTANRRARGLSSCWRRWPRPAGSRRKTPRNPGCRRCASSSRRARTACATSRTGRWRSWRP